MQEYLKEYQPVFYQTFKKALSENKLSHAYLLISKKGVNTSNIADYIAQSILCKETLFACDICETCLKVKEGNYIDYIKFDGAVESIKKKDIEFIQQSFLQSSVEGNEKIYVLEHIENATVESMNSLLKMLEEPTKGIYALFTCDNIDRVLPTITSRCQVIHFKAMNSKELVNSLINEHELTKENALILSEIYESKDQILEVVQTDEYFNLKVEAINFIEDYFFKKENLMINAQTHLVRDFKEKKDLGLFLDLTIILFRDILHKNYHLDLIFENQRVLIERCNEQVETIIQIIELLLETKEKIRGNSNIPLAMDYLFYHMIYTIT